MKYIIYIISLIIVISPNTVTACGSPYYEITKRNCVKANIIADSALCNSSWLAFDYTFSKKMFDDNNFCSKADQNILLKEFIFINSLYFFFIFLLPVIVIFTLIKHRLKNKY